MKNDTDQIVMDLLKKVEEKKQRIVETERPSWQTNCSFGYSQDSNQRINIQVVRELEELVNIHAFLSTRADTFVKSRVYLGLSAKDVQFKHLGFTYEQWNADIESRINQLRIKAQKDELAKLEERINALVSPEQRRAMELAKLVKEMT